MNSMPRDLHRPTIRIYPTPELASEAVAALILERIAAMPALTLGLATG